MKKNKKIMVFLIVGIMLVSSLSIVSLADTSLGTDSNIITISFSFKKPKISSISIDDKQFTRASIAGLSNSENAGAPALPKKTVRVLLPPKSSVLSIDVEKSGKGFISNVKNIELGSLSYYPLSIPGAEVSSVIEEDGVVSFYIDESGSGNQKIDDKYTPQYDTTHMYPKKLFINSGIQYKRGLPVLMVDLYPTQYDAASQTLTYYTDLTLHIKTEKDESAGFDSLYRGLSSDFAVISDSVDNPDMIYSYKNQGSSGISTTSDDTSGNMLIVTTEKLKSYSGANDLSKLVQAHKNKGMNNVYIETVESIDQHYSFDPTRDLWGPAKGKDFVSTQPLAYKIRKCVKDYYLNHGVDYVLLVGDDDYKWEEGVTIPPVLGPLARYENIKDENEVPTFQVFMGTIEAWIYIIDGASNKLPVANAGGPYSGKINEPIIFDASGSYDPDGSIVKYEWKFFSGDSWHSTGRSPYSSYTYSYNPDGTYFASRTLTLRVTDNNGSTSIDAASVSLSSDGGNLPPVANAGGPYSGKSGKSIMFDASRSYDPDGSIVKYEWKFSSDGNDDDDSGSSGDVTRERNTLCLSYTSESSPDSASSGGSIPSSDKGTWHSSGSNPRISHTFSSKGSHTVTVRVTDDDGATDTASSSVKVVGQDDDDNADTSPSHSVDSAPSQQETDEQANSEMSSSTNMQMNSDSTDLTDEEPYYRIDDIRGILASDQLETSSDGSGSGSGGNNNPPPGHWEHIFTRHVSTASDLPYSCLDNDGYLDDIITYSGGYKGPKFFPDLLSEVYVGRAPVSDVSDLQNFVKKTVSYMNAPASQYNKILNVGEHLGFGGVAEYAADSLNELINGCKHNGYKTVGIPSSDSGDSASSGVSYIVEKLYEKRIGWDGDALIDKINEGNVNIVNHLGHANVDFNMKLGTPGYWKHGARPTSGLKNEQYPIIYSQGCYAGAYDSGEITHSLFKEIFGSWLGGPYKYSNGEKMYHDSIAEYLTVKNSHGAVAGIWNSHFGWGMRASTDGPSQRYHREFIDAIFGEGKSTLGWANQDSKEDNLVRLDSWPMLWLYYCINLIGDPALKVKGALYNPPVLGQGSGEDGSSGSGGDDAADTGSGDTHNGSNNLPSSIIDYLHELIQHIIDRIKQRITNNENRNIKL